MSGHFLLHDWQIYMPVTIGARATYAQLDTGARLCRVTKAFAENFTAGDDVQAGGVMGVRSMSTVFLDEFTFLGSTFSGLRATVFDHDNPFDGLPFEVNMVLNSDCILAKPTLFDFRELRIIRTPLPDSNYNVGQTRRMKGLTFFTLEFEGGTLNTVFDLGAGSSVIHSEKLADFRLRQKLFDIEVDDTLGNEQVLDFYCLGKTFLQSTSFQLEAVATDLSSLSEMIGEPVDLILGINTMMQGRWHIDPFEKTLAFTRH